MTAGNLWNLFAKAEVKTMNLNVSGLDALTERIRSMQITEETENKAVKAAGTYLKGKISAQAYVTGLVRRSGKAASSVLMSDPKSGKLKVGYSNQEGAFYMFFHEFGTSQMDATPVVRPTYVQEKRNLNNIMAIEVRNELNL